jgi:hypothetical protein
MKKTICYVDSCGSEIVVITLWQFHCSGIIGFLFNSSELVSIDHNLTWLEDWGFNEDQVGVSDESSEEPDEGLLELIVALCRDIVVLEVLLSVEGDLLGLDLSVLDVDLVANQDNWDVLTDSDEILVPLGNVLVGDSGADIEHDDSAVTANAKYMINHFM